MVRVLRSGGKLGVTAWGATQNEFRRTWQSLAEPFARKEELQAAVKAALPWEEWFSDSTKLREAFHEAHLTDVEVHTKEYAKRISIADFLALRETSIPARFLRQRMNAEEWQRFRKKISEEFHSRFNDPIEDLRNAHIAIGTKS